MLANRLKPRMPQRHPNRGILTGGLQLIGNFIGRDPQFGVFLDHRFGFATGVKHRRVIATTKILTDLVITRSGQLACQIHCQRTGANHFLPSSAAFQIR